MIPLKLTSIVITEGAGCCNDNFIFVFTCCNVIIGPRQANLVLIAYASSEGSGEPAHPCSLARTSAEPPLLAHTSSESRGTFRQKTRSLAPLNGCACAVEICHDGMLEDTNSLDWAHIVLFFLMVPKGREL